MLTQAQITAGVDRLEGGKLSATDVDQIATVLGMDTFFGGFIEAYGYKFKEKLAEFDDDTMTGQPAAQIAACLNKMEELGFGVSRLSGELNYKEKDEYWQYVQLIFLKMYKLPAEFNKKLRRASNTAFVSRPEVRGFGFSERELRRRGR